MSIERELRRDLERTWGNTTPSGLFALEIDADTRDETGLSDALLIDAIVGFERVTGWAEARQAPLLAEFAHRRPGDDLPPDKATARKGLPKDLVTRLARNERDRRVTALWDGEVVPPCDEGPPPF